VSPAPNDALAAAQERYAAERAKRIRNHGLSQYVVLEDEHEGFDRDPWANSPREEAPVFAETDVVILGGGFSGMFTAIGLAKRGVTNFRIIEKGADFGGTWYWNRYPGCRCDVESYIYMPLLEETGYMPTERYTRASEIFEHCQRIGQQFKLYPHALFQTEVDTATWLEDEHRWRIITSQGDEIRCRFFVTAGGILNKAKLPAIAGIEQYKGTTFHTARWNYGYTGGGPTEPMTNLADKRVGIVGTGATAVQLVPELARDAKELLVFQRTPSPIAARGNGPTDVEWFNSLEPGWQRDRTRNFTAAVTGEQPEVNLVEDAWTDVMWDNTQRPAASPEDQRALDQLDFDVMQQLRDRVDAEVNDPATAESLKPWYAKYCKRVCFHDDYLATFNEPNVHLIDTDGVGVTEIGRQGPIVGDTEYPVDVLIFASGFEVTTGLVRRLGFDPVGRDGLALSERWSDGPHTLHGIMTAGFPNLLVLGTAQASAASNFVHFLSESSAHIAAVIARCQDDGIIEIETNPDAEDEWLYFLWGKAGEAGSYSSTCTPGYMNAEGEATRATARSVVHPGNVAHYSVLVADWLATPELPGVTVTK
jgi:cation diffusion facilitator CzcD-associated flavoprotein CzcO